MTNPGTKVRLFGNTIARPLSRGRWALMNRQQGGWASACMDFPSLEAIAEKFDVTIGDKGEDETGEYVNILVCK